MPTRNVVLTDHQHEMIEHLVRSGRYQNASEVLRDGLRLVETRAEEDLARREALRAAADAGWRDLEAGRYRDVPLAELAQYIGQLGERAAKQVRARG